MRFFITIGVLLNLALPPGRLLAQDGNPAYIKPVVVPGMFEHYSYYRRLPDANQRSLARYRKKAGRSKGPLRKGAALLDYAILLSKAEQAAYDAAQEKSFNPNLKVNNSKSQGYVKKSRRVLEIAVKKTGKGNPAAMFLYAYALALSGEPLAVNMFDEIVTGFKGSKMASEASLALGEFYFFSQDMDRAKREYEVALKSDDPAVRYYAQYKMAWANYLLAKGSGNSGALTKPLLGMADLIKAMNSAKGRKIKRLAKQVEFDVVGLAADLNDPGDVKRVLAQVGKPDVYEKTIERMAIIKAQSGDLATAYKLYASLFKSSADSEKAPEYSKMMIEIGFALQNPKIVYANLAYMGKNFLPKKAKWRKGKPKELLKKIDKEIPELIFGYGVEFDKLGFEGKNAQLRDYAYKLYSLYLAFAPKGPSISDARYNLAIIQTERQQFEAAAKNFARILTTDKKVKGKADIAALMVQAAANNIMNERQGYKLPPAGQVPKPIKFSKAGQLYNFTLELALKQPSPQDKKIIYLFELGIMNFDFGHYAEAKKYFNTMLKAAPKSEFAADAASRLFEYSIQQKDKRQFFRTQKLVSLDAQLKANENVVYYLSQGYPDKEKAKQRAMAKQNESNGNETAIAEDEQATDANDATNAQPASADNLNAEEGANPENSGG